MKCRSMKCVILITTVIFTTQAVAEIVVYGQEGQSVTLTPPLGEENKNAKVFWNFISKNGQFKNVFTRTPMGIAAFGTWIRDRVSLSKTGISLIIHKLKAEDFGVFECELHVGTIRTTTFRLYKITVSVSPSAVLLASQTLSLTCDVEKSSVVTDIEWMTPQKEIRESPSSPSHLTVKNITERDHGVWKCRVKYNNRTAEGAISVSVVDLSPNLPQPLFTSINSSSPFLLPCSMHSRLDSSLLSLFEIQSADWAFAPFGQQGLRPHQQILPPPLGPPVQSQDTQGQMINQSAPERPPSGNFSIVWNRGWEAGVYTCTLKFKNGVMLTRSVQVEVLRVKSSHSNPVQDGLNINITCTLGHPLSDKLSVTWTTPPRSPSRSKPLDNVVLSIHGVSKKDEGKWTCDLKKGSQVLTSAHMYLKTERIPVNIWLWVSICGAVVVVILIFVLILIFIRRRRQHMMFRQRRHGTKYCRCKHPQVKGFHKS